MPIVSTVQHRELLDAADDQVQEAERAFWAEMQDDLADLHLAARIIAASERTRRALRGHGAGVSGAAFAHRGLGHARGFLVDGLAIGRGVTRGSSAQGLGVRRPAFGSDVRSVDQGEAGERRPADPENPVAGLSQIEQRHGLASSGGLTVRHQALRIAGAAHGRDRAQIAGLALGRVHDGAAREGQRKTQAERQPLFDVTCRSLAHLRQKKIKAPQFVVGTKITPI